MFVDRVSGLLKRMVPGPSKRPQDRHVRFHKALQRYLRVALQVTFLLAVSGCDDLFEVTPYDVEVPDDLVGIGASNEVRIRTLLDGTSGPITFGVTSDPHYYYDRLNAEVSRMDADADIRFVVVTGDLTEQGLDQEYEWFAREMNTTSKPWLAVIGNHDHLSNGRQIYERMFGPRNRYLDAGDHRLVVFDDVVYESEAPPDTTWLAAAVAGADGRQVTVLTHIPDWTDALEGPMGDGIHAILARNGVRLVLHGHLHGFVDHFPYGDSVRYVCAPWPRDGGHMKVTLDGADVTVENVPQ
jgi:3',5'-cyclic AMP phosphodiesterase CpdA